MSKRVILKLVMWICVGCVAVSEVHAQKMYWTDIGADKIQRANLDGSNVEDVITEGLNSPLGIAIDYNARKLYWSDHNDGEICRADMDGSNQEMLLNTCCPWAIALDPIEGKIYWPWDYGWSSEINRANLDGSASETIVSMGDTSLEGIAFDPTNNKIYWTHYGTGKIRRSNFDGSHVESITDTESQDLAGIAIDHISRKMYWAEADTGKIRRANLDGSNIIDIVTGLDIPWGIALDLRMGKIYWTAGFVAAGVPSKISRANLDGSNIEVLVTGLEGAVYIALDIPLANPPIPTVSQWGLAATTLLMLCGGTLLIRRRIACPEPRPRGSGQKLTDIIQAPPSRSGFGKTHRRGQTPTLHLNVSCYEEHLRRIG